MESCFERIQSLVKKSGVSFQTQRPRGVPIDLQEIGQDVAKVMIAEADDDLIMLVLAKTARVDFAKLRAALSVHHASQAPEYLFRHRFADCLPGAMPPFGGLYDMRTLIDSDLARTDTIAFQVGMNPERFRMTTADYVTLAQPDIVAFAFVPSFGL